MELVMGPVVEVRAGLRQKALEPLGGAATHGQQAALIVPVVADEQRACGILHILSVTMYCAGLGAGSFASHGHCGRRHAVTACRETLQPRHVAARLRPQAVAAASRGACR